MFAFYQLQPAGINVNAHAQTAKGFTSSTVSAGLVFDWQNDHTVKSPGHQSEVRGMICAMWGDNYAVYINWFLFCTLHLNSSNKK